MISNVHESLWHLYTPRVIVIGHYPLSPYKVGDILALDEKTGNYIPVKDKEHVPALALNQSEVADSKRVFRKLEWYEYRTPEEMPAYLKYVYPTKIEVLYVSEWHDNGSKFKSPTLPYLAYTQPTTPAVKEEYDKYPYVCKFGRDNVNLKK